jgi:hypothetical protein
MDDEGDPLAHIPSLKQGVKVTAVFVTIARPCQLPPDEFRLGTIAGITGPR